MPATKRRRAPTCTVPGHEHVKLVCPACVGARGAGVPKPASARNGLLGGRPPKHSPECNAVRDGASFGKLPTVGCPRCEYDARKRKRRKARA
jgi:hypothetical protein